MKEVETVPGSMADSVKLSGGELVICLSGNGFLLFLTGGGAEQAAVRVSRSELRVIQSLIESVLNSGLD